MRSQGELSSSRWSVSLNLGKGLRLKRLHPPDTGSGKQYDLLPALCAGYAARDGIEFLRTAFATRGKDGEFH